MNEKQKNLLVLCVCLCTITDHIHYVLIILRILIFLENMGCLEKLNETQHYSILVSVKSIKLSRVLNMWEPSTIDMHVLYTRYIRYYNFLVGQTLP